jgi:hypothetical protein
MSRAIPLPMSGSTLATCRLPGTRDTRTGFPTQYCADAFSRRNHSGEVDLGLDTEVVELIEQVLGRDGTVATGQACDGTVKHGDALQKAGVDIR